MLRILQDDATSARTATPEVARWGVSLPSRGWTMDKKLCIFALSVGGLMLLLFILDLFIGIPFGGSGPFTYIDIIGIIASGILLYMGYHAYREVR